MFATVLRRAGLGHVTGWHRRCPSRRPRPRAGERSRLRRSPSPSARWPTACASSRSATPRPRRSACQVWYDVGSQARSRRPLGLRAPVRAHPVAQDAQHALQHDQPADRECRRGAQRLDLVRPHQLLRDRPRPVSRDDAVDPRRAHGAPGDRRRGVQHRTQRREGGIPPARARPALWPAAAGARRQQLRHAAQPPPRRSAAWSSSTPRRSPTRAPSTPPFTAPTPRR